MPTILYVHNHYISVQGDKATPPDHDDTASDVAFASLNRMKAELQEIKVQLLNTKPTKSYTKSLGNHSQ